MLLVVVVRPCNFTPAANPSPPVKHSPFHTHLTPGTVPGHTLGDIIFNFAAACVLRKTTARLEEADLTYNAFWDGCRCVARSLLVLLRDVAEAHGS